MICFFCEKPINGKYYKDSFDHIACASHIENGELSPCSSCTCFTDKTHSLSDGRVLCKVCASGAITSNDNITPLFEFTVKNLRRIGFDDLNLDDIKVEVTSAEFMARLRGDGINTNNKGITQSRVGASLGMFLGKKPSMQHTIYMLSHQPKAEFIGTLAHELLHAWQVQNSISPPPKLCEGLCNLASYHLLSMTPSTLSKVLIKNMHTNPDPIYGDGFRELYDMLEEMEWSGIIDFYKNRKF